MSDQPTSKNNGLGTSTENDNASANAANPPTRAATGSMATGPSKIFGNQAKKQEEVTRQGAHKMKFIPTLPARRPKPAAEPNQEATSVTASPAVPAAEPGRGRGRGRGRGFRGGAPPPRQQPEMIASGPFAMGPAMAGSSSVRKRVVRPGFTPSMPGSAGGPSGSNLSNTGAPMLHRDREKDRGEGDLKKEDEEVEVYSDPDEGVQIVDMNAIKTMDWMAPESLRKEKDDSAAKKSKKKIEALKRDIKGKGKEREEPMVEIFEEQVEINLANALNLSESEEEEEMEDLIEDFAQPLPEDENAMATQEKLYFFQFPRPFPTFEDPTENDVMDVDLVLDEKSDTPDKGKKVTFAEDVKPPGPDGPTGTAPTATAETAKKPKKLAGVIGQLLVHQSGAIKMRLNSGVVLDVTSATQSSFLQHAIYLDTQNKRMHVLGEVNRRYTVSPDIDRLLEEAEIAEAEAARVKAENGDAAMETT